jgi:putative ABC transport system ATP-binding protein
MVSGGQQQRAAVARAMANDSPLLLADEPTGNLDAATAEDVFGIFLRLAAQGKTIVMVTHNRSLATRVPRLIEIDDGIISRDEVIGVTGST